MKKLLSICLSMTFLLLLVSCGDKQPTVAIEPTDEVQSTEISQPQGEQEEYHAEEEDTGVLTLSIPEEFSDVLGVDKDGREYDSEHNKTVLYVFDKVVAEAAQKQHQGEDWGEGWLFTVTELDQLAYESFVSTFHAASVVFATNHDGTAYYVFDAIPETMATSEENTETSTASVENKSLYDWINNIPEQILLMNEDIVSFDMEAYLTKYAFDGTHRTALYTSDDGLTSATIVLGQPVGEGEGKIWAVDTVSYSFGNEEKPNVVRAFPVAIGIEQTANEYYAAQQEQADKGEALELLSAEGALELFVRDGAWMLADRDMEHFSFVEQGE